MIHRGRRALSPGTKPSILLFVAAAVASTSAFAWVIADAGIAGALTTTPAATCSFVPHTGTPGSGGGAGPTAITGVVAGQTKVDVACQNLNPPSGDNLVVATMASPLGAVIDPASAAASETDTNLSSLGLLSLNGTSANGTLAVPDPFVTGGLGGPGDPNGVCPPTQAQVNAGLVNCAIAVAYVSSATHANQVIPGAKSALLFASGEPTPAAPTLTVSPAKAKAGSTITVSGSGWWGQATATAPIPPSDILIGGHPVSVASVSVSPAVYCYTGHTSPACNGINASTVIPPEISGTFVVPATAASGSQIVKIDEPNSTAIAGNGPDNSVQATSTLKVNPLAITTTSLPSATLSQAYKFTLAATGGKAPYHWSIASGTLPHGLALNAVSGAISGKPTVKGKFPVGIKVVDSSSPLKQKATKSFTLSVSQ